jgi:hypothetical protein
MKCRTGRKINIGLSYLDDHLAEIRLKKCVRIPSFIMAQPDLLHVAEYCPDEYSAALGI